MLNKNIFEYAIIRLVPKVEREEFFNIGVLLFSKQKKFLDIKYFIDTQKLKAIAPEIEATVLNGYLNAWKLICDGKCGLEIRWERGFYKGESLEIGSCGK